MEIIIHGDKIKITDAMRDFVEEKLDKLNKYLEHSDNVRANVIVKVKGHEQTVEITIPLKSSFIIRSEETKEDFYTAVDKAVSVLERQIRKNKTKLTAKPSKASYGFDFTNIEVEEEKEEHKIVKRKSIEVKPMTEEEAILQMDLLGHEFYMFKDADTLKPAVVYRRKDGNYGIIESE